MGVPEAYIGSFWKSSYSAFQVIPAMRFGAPTAFLGGPQYLLSVSATRFLDSRNASWGFSQCFPAAKLKEERGIFPLSFTKKIKAFALFSNNPVHVGRKLSSRNRGYSQLCRWYLYAPLPMMINQNVITFNSVNFLDSINWAVVQCRVLFGWQFYGTFIRDEEHIRMGRMGEGRLKSSSARRPRRSRDFRKR